MTGTGASPVAFDPFEPGFARWPYDQYARLRRHDPVHRSALLEGWVLTRYDDVNAVLRHPTVSVDLDNAAPSSVVELQRERQRRTGRPSLTLVLRDDPDHNRLRRLMQRPFGPRPVERLRDMVTQRVDRFMARLAPQGAMDVIADFAYPLPVEVFCEMLGMPEEASPQFREWTMAVVRMLDPVIDEAEHARCSALMDEMYTYLDEQAEAKRRHPTDDVMTELVLMEEIESTRLGSADAEAMGGGGGAVGRGERMSRDELVAQLVTLYVAGHEPTMGLVGNGLLALLRQPEQLALLRRRPELLSNAVHELLRFDGPNQFVRRIVMEPLTLAGVTVEPGEVLYLGIGAANHDPARWDDPAHVHVDRPDAPHHLQFGSGAHACMGAHLARLQAEVALAALVHGLDDVELAGDPVWSDRMVIRGLQSLPITYRPAARAGR